jgi:hypothetical protein
MLLALLFYAYCTGLRSSRRIEAAVRSDLACKAICGDLVPDHIAIARFRADHEQAITAAFVDVLSLCAKAGLASVATVAIDGTKIGSDAALDQNRTESAIRAEVSRILSEASATDEVEAAQPNLGGELPEVLAHRASRLGRLQAALAEIEADKKKQRDEDDTQSTRWDDEAAEGRRPRGRSPKDPAQALKRAQADLAAATAKEEMATSTLAKLQAIEVLEQTKRSLAAAEKVATDAPVPPEREANTTDPESRILKTQSGWIQGFNAQAAVNEHQLVIACSLVQDANDVGQYLPMVNAVITMLAACGITDPIGVVLADAGYWSLDNALAEGPERLIATLKDWKQRKAAREMGTTTGPPPLDASALEAMEHRLRTEDGAATYGTRSYTVEPVFGQVKENRGFRRFMRRGLKAAESEWSLICATSNISKLFTHAHGRSLADTIAPAF